jgi:hypothetical protein
MVRSDRSVRQVTASASPGSGLRAVSGRQPEKLDRSFGAIAPALPGMSAV